MNILINQKSYPTLARICRLDPKESPKRVVESWANSWGKGITPKVMQLFNHSEIYITMREKIYKRSHQSPKNTGIPFIYKV